MQFILNSILIEHYHHERDDDFNNSGNKQYCVRLQMYIVNYKINNDLRTIMVCMSYFLERALDLRLIKIVVARY